MWSRAGMGAVVVGVVFGLAACSGTDTPGSVNVATALGSQLGTVGLEVDPSSLSCGGSPTRVLTPDTSLDCTFTSNGQPVGLTAKVASVDGAKVSFSLRTEAKAVPPAVLAKTVKARVGTALGAAVSGVSCPAALPPTVGATATCTVTSGDASREVGVQVTSVDGGKITERITAK